MRAWLVLLLVGDRAVSRVQHAAPGDETLLERLLFAFEQREDQLHQHRPERRE